MNAPRPLPPMFSDEGHDPVRGAAWAIAAVIAVIVVLALGLAFGRAPQPRTFLRIVIITAGIAVMLAVLFTAYRPRATASKE